MAKMGAPSKKDKINRDGLRLCYERGFTDKEVALALQITERTLNNWKKKDPDFFQTLKNWKNTADQDVERSLYERACGYTCPETKPQWVPGAKGEPGHWEYAEIEKHYPPDATSMIFWLKNRQPGQWRDRVDHEHSGTLTIEDKLRELNE